MRVHCSFLELGRNKAALLTVLQGLGPGFIAGPQARPELRPRERQFYARESIISRSMTKHAGQRFQSYCADELRG